MKRGVLAAWGGAVGIAALLALAPATLADRLCDLASGGEWRLAEARGTLWHGSAQPLRGDGTLALPRLDWRLDLGPLPRGAVALDLALAGGGTARLVATPGRLALNADGRLPAAAVAALAGAGRELAADGLLEIATAGLARDAAGYHGRLTLRWHAARLAATGARPLGSYRLDLDGAGDALAGRVHTTTGPLQVAGDLRWTPAAAPGRRLAADLTASLGTAPAADDPRLAALLDLAGRRSADGHRLELRL